MATWPPATCCSPPHGKPLLADLGVARMVADPSRWRRPAPKVSRIRPRRRAAGRASAGTGHLLPRRPGLVLPDRPGPRPGAERPPLRLLVPEVPAALAAALEAGLSGERRQRPAAAEFAALVYRSAQAEPVDLSVSVHPTVLPQLLTRRAVQTGQRRRGRRAGAGASRKAGLHRRSRKTGTREGRNPNSVRTTWPPAGSRGCSAGCWSCWLAADSCTPAPSCFRARVRTAVRIKV